MTVNGFILRILFCIGAGALDIVSLVTHWHSHDPVNILSPGFGLGVIVTFFLTTLAIAKSELRN